MKKDFEEIIIECVEIETDGGSHTDYLEDYNTSLDFYLSNMTGTQDQSYRYYLQESYNVTEEESQEIQAKIIRRIEEKCEL